MFEVKLNKKAEKYLERTNEPTTSKLLKALADLSELKGDIKPIKGKKNTYRLKIPQYRIIFERVKNSIIITVINISPRGDVYKKGWN